MSETYFVKQHKKDKYTILDNTCIQDDKLSWKSKGVHTYLMSLPDDWKIYITELVNHSSDGKAALYSAVQELEKHGYIRKIQNRKENGCFDNIVYYVFEKPRIKSDCSPLTDYPDADYPDTEKPDTDNRTLLTTNNNNYLDIQNTKLTNYKTETVSESVFVNQIKELFGGEYLFDKNFETSVYTQMEKGNINQDNLESYLDYVFERTKLANPIKSFEGLFRKLALSSSIIRDFRLSNNYESEEKAAAASIPKTKLIVCPVCHTNFNEFEDCCCPKCMLSAEAIKNNDEQEITIRTKIYQMSEEERTSYEKAFSDYEEQIKKTTGRPFLVTNEKINFYREYGIIN